jgi:hypothetical protein
MTDNFIFDTKGKFTHTEAVQKAIKFGIDRELPKLQSNEKLEVNIHVKEEGIVVDVLRVNKNKES